MGNRVDGGIIDYEITIRTASFLRLRVPGPSFIGLCVGASGIVAGVATWIARHHECMAASHHVLISGFLLVSFLQCLACLACVGMVVAKSVGPTIV